MIFRLFVRFHLYCLRLQAWFFETTPEPEPKPMREETADEYCECHKPGLSRVDHLKFRFQNCGHSRFEWSERTNECLQCVAEGRIAKRDMGRIKRG